MTSIKSKAEELTEVAKEEAGAAVDAVEETVRETAGDIGEAVAAGQQSVETNVRQIRARHRVQDAIDHAADRAHEWADRGIAATFEGVDHARQAYDRYSRETTTYIRRQPVKSVFLAAGIGAALAALLIGSLSRRDR